MESTPELQSNTKTPIPPPPPPPQYKCSADMKKSENLEHKYSQWTLCRILHAVQRVLLNSKAVMKKLAAENAALREQTSELPDDLLVSTMFMVKCDMVEALEFARASKKMFHAQHMKSNRTSKGHEETRFLTEILHTQRMEIEKVKKYRNMEQDHFNDMKRYFNNILIIFNAEGCVIQREISKMKTVQQEIEKKVSQVIQEKEDEITRVREEMNALVKRNLESLAKVRAIDTKVLQIETVKKEESLRKTQEMWKQIREMEEEWLNKEGEWLYKEEGWFYKESRMEKEELALKTDKVKEKRRITYFLPI